ncbi:MAG: S9 family peptidase [candidate division Zixibacteria bacterium]|nr:S9 family peptidase [candidate division Zixibacteria bacterium]
MILFHRSFGLSLLLLILLFSSALAVGNVDQDISNMQGYKMPPKHIADLVDAPWTPRISISPDNKWLLLMSWPGLPSIEEVAQPELRLAGLRFNPRTNSVSRGWHYNTMVIRKFPDGEEKAIIGLPANPKISNVEWSPDSKWIAFTLTRNDGVELWIVNAKDTVARKLSDVRINTTYDSPYEWMSDNKSLIIKTIPVGRGIPPEEPMIPSGPVIQENIGRKAPARTYQDLLENKYDESLFEYYLTSQLAKVTIDGKIAFLGEPGIIGDAIPSPDAKYILVETVHKPFSYTVPHYRFPVKTEVWDIDGKFIYEVVDQPLADEIPIAFGSCRTGKRRIGWRQEADATLFWVEAQDGGDAGNDADIRDKVFMLPAPFTKKAILLITFGLRFESIEWGNDDLALVTEYWWKTRKTRKWLVAPGSPQGTPKLIEDRSFEDRYNDPGDPMMYRTKKGTYILLTADKGRTIFLSGSGASSEGDRPFLDEMNLKTLKTKRLFRSQAPYYEVPYRMLNVSKRRLLTMKESVNVPLNLNMRDLKKKSSKQITFFENPTPLFDSVQKEIIKYKRDDGVELSGTLYLPSGYTPEDGPLPLLMWAYPHEYKSADAASQVSDSPYRFLRIWWSNCRMWLAHGYAVLDDPSMPVVGEGDEEPNDTFIEQLVASARAAVDEVVRRGVTDRNRIAIGGHSYGAFMAANLLAHSDLFRTAIARTGAYNRTLTPFGFQSEDRTLWETPEIYFAMSPFMHADKVNEPILLIHGLADNNSGTFPMQSERFYSALKGNGATVRLVMLPNESHGYRARESAMHVLWETMNWLDKYVKNVEPRAGK